MMAKLPYGSRAVGIVGCLLGLGLTGCILPVPTVPLNLPAHGHTYKVRDRANLPPAGEGILIMHSYYHYATERVDCYSIRDGQAVVPARQDVRVQPCPMFGYFSLVVPTWYLFFINAHHAHVYPVMPGLTYWDDFFSPMISEGRFIYGLKPRPEVFRLFPSNPYEERASLKDIEQGMQTYFIQADNSRKDGCGPSREELHNEAQARLIVQYVHERRQALDIAPASQPAPAEAPTSQPAPRPADNSVAQCGLSSRERAFRGIEACDYATLERELKGGLDPDSYDSLPWTLLNRSVALGDIKAVRMLVEYGADINRRLPRFADSWFAFYGDTSPAENARLRVESEGHSPLVLAAGCGELEILKYLESKGAKAVGLGTGYTLMHAAGDKFCDMQTDDGPGRRAVLAYFVEKGLDVNAVYKPSCGAGGTPLDLARDYHKALTAEFLAAHGGKRTRKTLWPPESEKDK